MKKHLILVVMAALALKYLVLANAKTLLAKDSKKNKRKRKRKKSRKMSRKNKRKVKKEKARKKKVHCWQKARVKRTTVMKKGSY